VVSRNWWISFYVFCFTRLIGRFIFPQLLWVCVPPIPQTVAKWGRGLFLLFASGYWVLFLGIFWFLLFLRTCVPARFLFFLSLRLTELRKRGSVVGATVAYKSLHLYERSCFSLLINPSIIFTKQHTIVGCIQSDGGCCESGLGSEFTPDPIGSILAKDGGGLQTIYKGMQHMPTRQTIKSEAHGPASPTDGAPRALGTDRY
jgi:hypothetical protein